MGLSRRSRRRRGLLALEWVLIITVLVIGIVGGLGLVRNAVVEEMYALSQSILGLQVDPDAPAQQNLLNGPQYHLDLGGPETILAPNDPQLH